MKIKKWENDSFEKFATKIEREKTEKKSRRETINKKKIVKKKKRKKTCDIR